MIVRRAVPTVLVLLLAGLAGADPAPVPRPPTIPADSLGIVTGRLQWDGDARPLPFANVVVLGTRRGTLAGEDGWFRIVDVPPGRHTLRIVSIGVHPRDVPIEVRPGLNALGIIEFASPRPLSTTLLLGDSPVDSGALVASIRPTADRVRVGDRPAFDVRIRNHGERTVRLVQSVDASDRWASPRVWIEIEGPAGGFVVPPLAFCGNNNGVRPADVADVAPGASFDPYAGGWRGANLTHGRFAKAGRYVATFHYSTMEREARKWMGGPCGDCEVPESFRALLAGVPAVDLSASVEFAVEEP